jgi:hypothetical protein
MHWIAWHQTWTITTFSTTCSWFCSRHDNNTFNAILKEVGDKNKLVLVKAALLWRKCWFLSIDRYWCNERSHCKGGCRDGVHYGLKGEKHNNLTTRTSTPVFSLAIIPLRKRERECVCVR